MNSTKELNRTICLILRTIDFWEVTSQTRFSSYTVAMSDLQLEEYESIERADLKGKGLP